MALYATLKDKSFEVINIKTGKRAQEARKKKDYKYFGAKNCSIPKCKKFHHPLKSEYSIF